MQPTDTEKNEIVKDDGEIVSVKGSFADATDTSLVEEVPDKSTSGKGIKTDITLDSAEDLDGAEKPQMQGPPPLSHKDVRSLNKAKYNQDEFRVKHGKSYVLLHKSGKIVELFASSVIHACGLIGWRPRHVRLLAERTHEEEAGNTEL